MNLLEVAECLWMLLLSATTIKFVFQRVSRTYLIFSDLGTDTSWSCLWKPVSFLPNIMSNRPWECLLKRGEKLLSAFLFPGERELLWGSRQALCCSRFTMAHVSDKRHNIGAVAPAWLQLLIQVVWTCSYYCFNRGTAFQIVITTIQMFPTCTPHPN